MKRMLVAALFAIAVGATLTAVAAQPPASQPPPAPPPVPSLLKAYTAVTAERLKRPAPDDWLMVRGAYEGWSYSPLEQISPQNEARLQPLWVFATGATNGHEAPAL